MKRISSTTQQTHKKFEFSKFLVIWALIITTVALTTSYILALLGHDPCQEITVSIAGACIAIAVSYEAKSYGEKNSRNKYRVSEDGEPFQEETVYTSTDIYDEN